MMRACLRRRVLNMRYEKDMRAVLLCSLHVCRCEASTCALMPFVRRRARLLYSSLRRVSASTRPRVRRDVTQSALFLHEAITQRARDEC